MKTPRDLLFEKHAAAAPSLDRARRAALARIGERRTDARSTFLRLPRFWLAPRILWSEMFLPAKRIWQGLAVAWVFMLGAGMAMFMDTPAAPAMAVLAPPSPEMARAIARQRLELAQLIQMDVSEPASYADVP